jgi:hypothetical protein
MKCYSSKFLKHPQSKPGLKWDYFAVEAFDDICCGSAAHADAGQTRPTVRHAGLRQRLGAYGRVIRPVWSVR